MLQQEQYLAAAANVAVEISETNFAAPQQVAKAIMNLVEAIRLQQSDEAVDALSQRLAEHVQQQMRFPR